MSTDLTTDVWKTDIKDSRTKLILLCLADVANYETLDCFPSVKYIADRCGCSTRTVHRHLEHLEEKGIIIRSHRFTETGGQRSNTYQLNIPPCQNDTPPVTASDTPPPDTDVIHNRNNNRNTNLSCSFERFWDIYPRKVSKKKAQQAFKKHQHLADQIIDDVKNRIANDEQWQDKKYIPHPTTYLNGEKWNDELTPKELSEYDAIWQQNRQFCENENAVDGNGCDIRPEMAESIRPNGVGSVSALVAQSFKGYD